MGDHGVGLEAAVLRRLGVEADELHVGEAGGGGRAARVGQRDLVAVDADDATGARRQRQRKPSAPGADVEDRAAGEILIGEELQERGADRRISR